MISDGSVKPIVGDGVAMALVGDILIALWRDTVTPDRWRWAKEQVVRATTQWPEDGVVVVVLMLSTSSPPDAETRTLMSDTIRNTHGLRRLIATPLGNSVWRSVARTLIRALFLIGGRSHLQSVASDLEHAIQTINEVATAVTPPAAEIRRAAEALYSALDISPAAVA